MEGLSLLHRKELIIITAIEVISEFGIQGFSTREVAKRQGISEATIFKHYKTKNELLLAVLEYYSKFDTDIMKTIKIKKMRAKEAIIFFINSYSEYYGNYPSLISIEQSYEALLTIEELSEKAKEIFFCRLNFLKGLIKYGKTTGEILLQIDSENLAEVILGFFRNQCLSWKMQEYSFSLKEKNFSTLVMVLGAFTPNNK